MLILASVSYKERVWFAEDFLSFQDDLKTLAQVQTLYIGLDEYRCVRSVSSWQASHMPDLSESSLAGGTDI